MDMTTHRSNFGSFSVGLYGWLVTIFFGMILADILNFRLAPVPARVSSDAADILLLIGIMVVISAVFALAFSHTWTEKALVLASLSLFLLEFLIPALVSPFLRAVPMDSIGPWLRILPGGGASILALSALCRYNRL